VQRFDDRSRRRWFAQYLETVLRREVETAADLRRFDALTGMARLLIARSGSEHVISRLAADLGIDRRLLRATSRGSRRRSSFTACRRGLQCRLEDDPATEAPRLRHGAGCRRRR
jgi:hypothetical protein